MREAVVRKAEAKLREREGDDDALTRVQLMPREELRTLVDGLMARLDRGSPTWIEACASVGLDPQTCKALAAPVSDLPTAPTWEPGPDAPVAQVIGSSGAVPLHTSSGAGALADTPQSTPAPPTDSGIRIRFQGRTYTEAEWLARRERVLDS